MKKLCIITTISATLKSFVVETAKYLHEQKGYDITLICNPDSSFEKILPSYLHYIPVPMKRGINFSGFKSIKALEKIFKKEKFDCVQYATPNASFYASQAAKKAKIPVRLYCQWGIRYVGFKGVKRLIFKALEKLVCLRSTDIFAVSPLNREFAIKEGLYKAEKVKVIGNGGTIGVDTGVFDVSCKNDWRTSIRERYAIAKQDFTFGFVGRISVDKGCEELLCAFQAIAKEYDSVKLFIVGNIEENCGITKETFAWAKNSDKVIFTGDIEYKDIKKYYAAMDVLVHPTYREGFGMVLQEAGALAVPAITTKIPGASEVMEDKTSCLLVEAKNVIELRTAMCELLIDHEKVERLGQGAYERTIRLYERRIMLENQKEAYTILLGE